MLELGRFQELNKQILEIQDKYPNISPEEAFVIWFLRAYVVDNETQALEGLTGESYDKGIDAIYFDHDLSKVYVIQGKYHKGSKTPLENRSDVIALANLGEILFDDDNHKFNNLIEKSSPGVKDRLISVRTCLLKKDYQLVLQFVTTGKVSLAIKKEAEGMVESQDSAFLRFTAELNSYVRCRIT